MYSTRSKWLTATPHGVHVILGHPTWPMYLSIQSDLKTFPRRPISIAPARALSVRLAARDLLHDADDRKYFPETCTTYANAVRIMEEAGVPDEGKSVLSDAIEMIKLVSCSANGNSAPPQTRDCHHPSSDQATISFSETE